MTEKSIIAQDIIDEVQRVANEAQYPAYRYEVRNGKTYEVKAYPKPTYTGERQPVPTPDSEGHLHDGNGRMSRCVAVAIQLENGKPVDEATRLYDLETDKGEDGVERPRAVFKESFLRPAAKRDDGTLTPDDELREWVNASRRRSVRLYGDAFVPVEYKWIDVEEDIKIGAKPEVIERDDLDVE